MPIGDGVTLARVLLGASDEGDPGPGHRRDGRTPLRTRRGARQQRRRPRAPARIRQPWPPRRRTRSRWPLPRTEPSPVFHGDGRPGHRVAWSDPIDLWRVKRVARPIASASTTSSWLPSPARSADIVLAEHGEPQRLHALVPLNLRPLDEPVPEDLGESLRTRPRRASGRRLGRQSTGSGRSTADDRDQALGRGRDHLRHPQHDGSRRPPQVERGCSSSSRPRRRWSSPTSDRAPRSISRSAAACRSPACSSGRRAPATCA